MGIFGRRSREKQPIDESRRNFLRDSALAVGGLAISLSKPGLVLGADHAPTLGRGPFPWSDEQVSNFLKRGVPRGIIFSGDPALPQLWDMGLNNTWHSGSQEYTEKLAKWGLGGSSTGRTAPIRVHPETPYHEPAFYMTANKFRAVANIDYDRLERENPALFYFAAGLADYFRRWEGRGRRQDFAQYERSIEENFMASILVAAQRPQTDASAYQAMPGGERERFLAGIADSIKGCNYNCQLVAAWSSFMLARHHWVKSRKKGDPDSLEMHRLVNLMENPLRILYDDKRLSISGENKYLNNSV